MKGIIIKYFDEKGFGFIRGEDDKEYFFHISQMDNAQEFLDAISHFLCRSIYDENCRMVEFVSISKQKGPEASKIKLSDQLINDIGDTNPFEGVITDVTYSRETLTRTVSGIKKGMSPPAFSTVGGNGTFRVDYPEVYRFLVVSFRRKGEMGWGKFECHKQALLVNGRNNITESFVAQLKNNLTGRTATFLSDGEQWQFTDPKLLVT